MKNKAWKVVWNEDTFGTYLYGSKIWFPGTIIKEWYSKVNYQMMRTEPSLPIIDGESSYHIQVNMSDFELYLVRMVFYDRYENEAGTLIIREPEMDFKCPLKTYSYRVQLINAGGTKMHFHSFVITEKEG